MGDIIVLVALGLIVGAVIYSMIRNRKKGGSGCSCGCQNCAHSASCHGTDKQK